MNKSIYLISLFSIFLILGACSNSQSENNVETEQTNNVIEENEDTVSENDTENWVSTGIHHEKIDSETIEINTEENKETYMLSDSAKKDLETIKKDEEISFSYEYHKNKKHPVIESIKDVNYDWESHHDKKYKYDKHYHHHDKKRHNHKHHSEDYHQKPHHGNQDNHHNNHHGN